MSYNVTYSWNFMDLSHYILDNHMAVIGWTVFVFVLCCSCFCAIDPSILYDEDERKEAAKENAKYKINCLCVKWCKDTKQQQWVIDAKDVHIDSFRHVFDLFAKKKIITHKRNSMVRRGKSLLDARKKSGLKET